MLFIIDKMPGGNVTLPELLRTRVRMVDRRTKKSQGAVPLSMLLKKLG